MKALTVVFALLVAIILIVGLWGDVGNMMHSDDPLICTLGTVLPVVAFVGLALLCVALGVWATS